MKVEFEGGKRVLLVEASELIPGKLGGVLKCYVVDWRGRARKTSIDHEKIVLPRGKCWVVVLRWIRGIPKHLVVEIAEDGATKLSKIEKIGDAREMPRSVRDILRRHLY